MSGKDRVRVFDCLVNRPDLVLVDCSGDICHTKQSFALECDINEIMRRYQVTGILEPGVVSERQAVFGDFTGLQDFTELQERLLVCRRMFDGLDASVRSRFNNNPGELIEFISREENFEESVRLGLLEEVKEVPAVPAGVEGSVSPKVEKVPEVAHDPLDLSVRTDTKVSGQGSGSPGQK